ERFYGLLPPESRPRWVNVSNQIYRTVGGYVTGNLLISLIAGGSTTIVLIIMGVPYAVALGLLVAILDLIPLAGATIAAILTGASAQRPQRPPSPKRGRPDLGARPMFGRCIRYSQASRPRRSASRRRTTPRTELSLPRRRQRASRQAACSSPRSSRGCSARSISRAGDAACGRFACRQA